METPDYDDPEVEEEWCRIGHGEVMEYLAAEGVPHGEVADWPVWYVVPFLSVWAVESRKHPGSVGWWVIYGDLPTDYVSAGEVDHPREVLRAIAWRWKEFVDAARAGKAPDDESMDTETPKPELLDLLEGRAGLLLEMAADDDAWDEE
jgi:hypothetical protein